jgi:hypothetical protein
MMMAAEMLYGNPSPLFAESAGWLAYLTAAVQSLVKDS